IRALASEANLQIRVEENWGEYLPFEDETFDLVHARQVLHHARDLAQLCREAVRVLKKGGVLVATREHVISRPEELAKFQAAHPLHQLYGGENAYRAAEYITALESAGLELTAVLNPMQSDINLFPQTRSGIRRAIARRLRLPAAFIPDWALDWIGRLSRAPGRLYTFVGRKA
ncbi:MAG TPA: methyltransferase domain-containing protein, partial [Gallionellaceae bacterium]|nr:methyltransferase domain-containing protein [Gallionellaceae bacterium]